MIYSQGDYRSILEQRYTERHSRNPSYSLRAFARDLEISVSRLSEVMNRLGHLSAQSADQIAHRLDFDDDERAYFRDLVDAQTARSEAQREQAQLRLLKYRFADDETQVTMDQFKLIAEWYHFAILELFKTKAFVCTPKRIAAALDLSEDDAAEALARLERLQFVEKKAGSYRLVRARTFTDSKSRSQALRNFHARVLEKAAEALGTQVRAERVSLAAIGAVGLDQIEGVRGEINQLAQTFVAKHTKQEDADHVYCLSVNFFRLDHKVNDETEA